MIRQKLISLTGMTKKLVHIGLNKSDADYLEVLKKQRNKYIFKRSFQNSMKNTIFGILCIIVSLIILPSGLWLKELPSYFFALILIIEFVGIALLLPFYYEIKFFSVYYNTYYSIMHILHSKQTEKYDSYLEKFQINYNILRKQMKKQIISSKGNFLTYDYEIKRIVHEIDTFFDSTTRILFQRKVMSIPYLPREEVEQSLIKEKEQYLIEQKARRLSKYDQRFDDYDQYNEYDLDNHDINEINFNSIKEFMRIYGKFIIKNPQTKSINTVAIAELFRKWNSVVNRLEPDIFEQSKKDVDKYYSKKQENQNYLFYKACEIIIIFIITIVSGSLLSVFL